MELSTAKLVEKLWNLRRFCRKFPESPAGNIHKRWNVQPVDTVDKPEIPRFAGFLATSLQKNRDFLGKQAGIPLQKLEYTESEGIP